MDLLATARPLEAIQAEVVRSLAAESEPVAGGWMAANGPGSYLNKTAGLGFEAEPTDEDVARVERFFASRGIEPRVELTMFAPVGFLRWLAERGFVLQDFENTLVLPLAGLGDPRALLPGGWPERLRGLPGIPRPSLPLLLLLRTPARRRGRTADPGPLTPSEPPLVFSQSRD